MHVLKESTKFTIKIQNGNISQDVMESSGCQQLSYFTTRGQNNHL